jgi:SAM-dependent methyltransferase
MMADKAAEAQFFDEDYSSSVRASVGQVYSLIRNRNAYYERLIYTDVAGRRVLEYGCGTGSHSLELARRGAEVVGIDISPVGIEKATARAAEAGFANAEYRVMDAEKMTFADREFDLVIGEGILHHLNLNRAFSEIARVLKHGGRAVFQEPLDHNPAIALFRRMTPRLRTKDEHPLRRRDLTHARKFFEAPRYRYFHLTSFAALALLKTRIFYPTVDMLDKVDAGLFKLIPGLGYLSWYVVMELVGPREHSGDVARSRAGSVT